MAINHFSPHSHYKTISGCVKIRHGSLSLHRSSMISLFILWPLTSDQPTAMVRVTIIITDLIIPVMQKYIWNFKAGKTIFDDTNQFMKRWKVNFMKRWKDQNQFHEPGLECQAERQFSFHPFSGKSISYFHLWLVHLPLVSSSLKLTNVTPFYWNQYLDKPLFF